MNMDRTRDRIAAIMERFPAETARISRPGVDAYRQPTDERKTIGTVRCWRALPERPTSMNWTVEHAGQKYDDHAPVWICIPWREDLPEVRHGDVCVLDDGVERFIRNIQPRGNIRVFWQLSEV